MRHHTKRDLVKIFKERGIAANRLLGQNFLVDHNVLEYICGAAELSDRDVVFEIGAGTGLLTEHLAQRAGTVVAVEIDKRMFDIASEYLAELKNVKLLHADVHGPRRRLNPEVEAVLAEAVAPVGRLKVVSNLPYCISSDLIISLLEMPLAVERMVVTVQEEFADRLLAGPGTRDYSALTVLVTARARVEPLRNIPPEVFWPVPKVGSTILRVTPEPERADAIRDYQLLKAVVAALFAQRRKTARGALKSVRHPRITKGNMAFACEAAGIDERIRADAVPVDSIVALANASSGESN